MQLHYLLFDLADDQTGTGSFDAMASVLPDRLPALAHEIEAVLQWACEEFGAPLPPEDGGQWDFELQGTGEQDTRVPVAYDVEHRHLKLPQATSGRVTLSLTLSGSHAFCEAFSHAFPVSD